MNKHYKNILFYLVVLLLSLFIGALMFFPSQVRKVWPYSAFVVVSESMDPLINKNDVIVVKQELTYNVGDIITFEVYLESGESYLYTHIYAEDTDEGILTRSLNPERYDFWTIDMEDIVGKYLFRVPKLGYLLLPLFKYARYVLIFFLILVLIAMIKVYRQD